MKQLSFIRTPEELSGSGVRREHAAYARRGRRRSRRRTPAQQVVAALAHVGERRLARRPPGPARRTPRCRAARVMGSRRPCAACSIRPGSAVDRFAGGSQGARATTPRTRSWSATRQAVRPPIEWPERPRSAPSPCSSPIRVQRPAGVLDPVRAVAVPADRAVAQQPRRPTPSSLQRPAKVARQPQGAAPRQAAGVTSARERSLPPCSTSTTPVAVPGASYEVRLGAGRARSFTVGSTPTIRYDAAARMGGRRSTGLGSGCRRRLAG